MVPVREKLLFVIPTLEGGGAEMALIRILGALDRGRFEPALVVFNDVNDYKDYMPAGIRVMCLHKSGRYDFFRIVFTLAGIIRREKPSLVISFMLYTNLVSVLARAVSNAGTALLLVEQNHVSIDLGRERLSRLKGIMIKTLYPRAEGVVCVSSGVAEDLKKEFGVDGGKLHVIYNPCQIENVQSLKAEEVEHQWFRDGVPVLIACGRLSAQKNYPLLLRAFARVLRRTEARLVILGTGELKGFLVSYARGLGVDDKVDFLGFQKNPFKYISRSDILLLSSDHEGLPNVITEAMACGTPVISTDCPSGPGEIISDGMSGLLVPVNDEKGLSDAVIRLLKDDAIRKRLADAGRKRADDFGIEKIVREYEGLFLEITGHGGVH